METAILESQLKESQKREIIIRKELEEITRKYNETIMSNFNLVAQIEKLKEERDKYKLESTEYWDEIERLRILANIK